MSAKKEKKLKRSAGIIFIIQFIGMLCMGISTITPSPLGIMLSVTAGGGLITMSIFFWLFLFGKEVVHWMKLTDRLGRTSVEE